MNKKNIIAGIIIIVIVLSCICGGVVILLNIQPNYTKDKQESETTESIDSTEKLNGWQEEGNNKYYYENDEKKTGWLEDNDKWYYLGNDGKMRTGWIKDNDHWYYMNDDGTMAVNTTVDGCYLNEKGIIEATPTPKEDENKVENQKVEDIQYATYTNDRYLFSVDYPIDFIPMRPPDNNDGRRFQRSDGQVYISASGSNNVLDTTINEYYTQILQDISGVITYKTLNNNSFAISWLEDGQVKYTFVILGNASKNTFTVAYPEREKEKYDPMVEHIYNTFRTPGINESH